ncbi:MAG: hypothetical protein L0387_33915 [Acidobacteria bacterium]|nr:hypothetical protein [Acidobacteriota bacterium]MCI0626593.1 hypothetical protein [Acidobacteriota bacterium]MCI0721184.1 hypothetical protein [Acidobacteriota bacterium]
MNARQLPNAAQYCMFRECRKPTLNTFLLRMFLVLCNLILSGSDALAQTFSSGSNGSDGALNFSTPGVIDFNPRTAVPPLDVDGDNVFHFTTINIGAGVTVRLTGQVFNGPVTWLASGNVTIAGTLELSGENGYQTTAIVALRKPPIPGPGGYAGGVGGNLSVAPQAGLGPGGGAGSIPVSPGTPGQPGSFTGNQFLVPLIGGSGGGGALVNNTTQYGSAGGAGGGAILIASSATITIDGAINARGGRGDSGGGGSGGAIRLVGSSILGSGSMSADGGFNGTAGSFAGAGRIRLEAFTFQADGFAGRTGIAPVNFSSPSSLLLPTTPPSVRVVSVSGVPVPPNPTGSFQVADTTITSPAAVTVALEAKNIPLGTVLKLYIYSENGPDIIADSTALQGTTGLSTATATVTFPPGFSRGFVRATWTQ